MATLAEVNKTLYGNGQKGLVSRVDLLEARQSEMLWWMRLLGSTIILYVLGVWLGFLQAPIISSSSDNSESPQVQIVQTAPTSTSPQATDPAPIDLPIPTEQIERLLEAARTLFPALQILPLP